MSSTGHSLPARQLCSVTALHDVRVASRGWQRVPFSLAVQLQAAKRHKRGCRAGSQSSVRAGEWSPSHLLPLGWVEPSAWRVPPRGRWLLVLRSRLRAQPLRRRLHAAHAAVHCPPDLLLGTACPMRPALARESDAGGRGGRVRRASAMPAGEVVVHHPTAAATASGPTGL